MAYALACGRTAHGIAVGIELGRIQVAVGVNPYSHVLMMPDESLHVHSASIRATVKTVRPIAAQVKVTGCPGPPSTAAPAMRPVLHP